MLNRVIVRITLVAAIMLSSVYIVNGQAVTGGIRGEVKDDRGDLIPNTTITVKNNETGLSLKVTTTKDGTFYVAKISPGIYTLTAENKNFKKTELTNIEIATGRDTILNIRLETGQVSEVVVVVGGAEALVEKSSAQISSTFEERKVNQLPINTPGGGLDGIALQAPGVTMGFGNVNGNGMTLSANGNRARSNNFTIDGVDNNDLSIGGPTYFVQNPKVVGEVQVITNNFSAEYGRNQGAVVNYVSKSGTKDFHGDISWDHMDNANFNSLTNLEKRAGDKGPAQRLTNVFAYGVGGPVVLPGLNLRDKIFFYTTGFFFRNPGSVTVQTTSMSPTKEGAALLKSTFPTNTAIQYWADYSAFNMPIGNPQLRLKADGTPLQSTVSIGGVSIPVAAVKRQVVRNAIIDEYTAKIDANITDRHRVFGRYFRQFAPGKDQLVTSNGFSGDVPQYSRQLGGGWTWSISSRLTNDVRVNYSRLFLVFGGGGSADKGNIPHTDDIGKALTNMSFSFTAADGSSLLAIGPATNLPQGRIVNAYQFGDSINFFAGNHQLKAGIDFRKLTNIAPFLPNLNGNFQFTNTAQVATNAAGNTVLGNGTATLSYDEVDQFFFFQDDWRIRPNLTLNLGLRYENTGQPINVLNDLTEARENDSAKAFWLSSLPIGSRTTSRLPADNNNIAPRIGFAYSPNFEKGLLGKVFGKDKTTLRGGYGIAYDATFYNLLLNISTSAPVVFLTGVPGFAMPGNPTGDVVRNAAINSGLIQFKTIDPTFLARTTINPNFYSPYAQQFSFGMQREFGASKVFEIRYVGTKGSGLFQTINANPFIGNLVNGFTSPAFIDKATGLPGTIAFQSFKHLLPAGTTALSCTNTPATPTNESTCNGRMLPSGIARERINGVKSIYHGLQMRFDSRLAKQLTFGLAYTWSHAIDNSSEVFQFNGGNSVAVSQNPLDLTKGERGNSGFDARHLFSANFIWDIPFFRSGSNLAGKLLGGWQFNGIIRIQQGRPFQPTHLSASNNPYEDAGFMGNFFGTQSHFRPFSSNPNAPLDTVAITDVDACLYYSMCGNAPGTTTLSLAKSPTGFYSINAFNKDKSLTPVSPNDVRFIVNGPGAARVFGTPFGNVSRNSFFGDRLEKVDLSVFKTFRITERLSFKYKLEMFNAFNHVNFGIPNTITVNTAGTTFFNFKENDGSQLDAVNNGRRVISMGLAIIF